jgi:hypothetical protein
MAKLDVYRKPKAEHGLTANTFVANIEPMQDLSIKPTTKE